MGFGRIAPFASLLPQIHPLPPLNDYLTYSTPNPSGQVSQTPQDRATIQRALDLLGNIQNLPDDEAHMRQLGIHVIFHNGQEALNLIHSKGIRVEFGDMGDSPAHAQWIADKKLIMINQRYRGDNSPATQYAISEAIYHEAGHAAKLMQHPITKHVGNLSFISPNPDDVGDDVSSIQEELNCLALNTLAHRYHTAIDPSYAQTISSSPLLSDGVALYAKLFFDPDPRKQALINRVVTKYGDLPLCSPGHEQPSLLACQIAQQAALQQKSFSGNGPQTLNQASSPFVLPAR
jgi:hypothetical protein